MRMLDVLGEKCYSVHGETTGVSYIISIQKRAYELVSHHGDIIWRKGRRISSHPEQNLPNLILYLIVLVCIIFFVCMNTLASINIWRAKRPKEMFCFRVRSVGTPTNTHTNKKLHTLQKHAHIAPVKWNLLKNSNVLSSYLHDRNCWAFQGKSVRGDRHLR